MRSHHTRTLAWAVLIGGAFLAAPTAASGQQPATSGGDSIRVHVLDPIVVEGRLDDLTGIATTASQGFVGYRNFRLRPLSREGELLETVPGLIMTQHSGEGKSNQMFVRGFNLDHGTDFSTRIDGMPINIPTHAHGHGYTDINFIVPEFVDHVEYKLGNYYADIGDFGSAGGAELRLKTSLPRPLALVGVGEDGYLRTVAAAPATLGSGQLLVGGEFRQYDGPWAIPQDLGKFSGMARYSVERGANLFSVLALGYDNEWDSSDQIPRRLVEDGTIDRYSQVDSTLGGATSRYSLSATWSRRGEVSSQRIDVYGIKYDLDLFSNFTYLLDDPANGDEFQQSDDGRSIFGANLAHVQGVGRHSLTLGSQARLDLADIALYRTDDRQIVSRVRADEVTEWTIGAYAELETEWTPSVRTVLGLRGDYFSFDVMSDLPANSGAESAGLLSPKASIVIAPTEGTEVYVSGGLGFHSNDARGTVQTVHPVSGDPVDAVDPLVRSTGAEFGLRATLREGWRSTLALWLVELDSELLFVGDAGTTEPSDGSRRFGATWASFYRISPTLSVDLDVSLARARFTDVAEGEDRIPGALENVIAAGLSWEPEGDGPYGALRFRRFGEYALIEDDSVRSDPATLVNANLGWSFGQARIGVSVLNLFDAEASDIQYLYGSRVSGEPADGVEGIHFHPAEPLQFRLTASWGL